MSSRFYPIYQKGNPQLRIFLPNFCMKLVKPSEIQPPNVVEFRVPLAMSNHDIKNYLEKIYNVKVMHVASEMIDGDCVKGQRGYVVKKEDYRRAIVTLPRDVTFQFPELETEEIKSKERNEVDKNEKELKTSYDNITRGHKNRYGLPPWFSI